jgi:3-isopropylmalate/(R)-2-methylmalate dehydratase small subunit
MTASSFTTLTSKVLLFLKDDVDTDQIIPARFLKGTTRDGFGKWLFYDWRYDADGNIKPDSPFDNTPNAGAGILVARHNFGCGSSREHAPWALKDYGIQAILAESFADIFYNNALKNAVLPVPLGKAGIDSILKSLEANPAAAIKIDLAAQTVTLPNSSVLSFEINTFRKHCLLHGQDDIDFVLSHAEDIVAFEVRRT